MNFLTLFYSSRMVHDQVLLAKYMSFNTKLNSRSKNSDVNFVTGRDSNYNYYKIKYSKNYKIKTNSNEDIVIKNFQQSNIKEKKTIEVKKVKSLGNGKKKLKEFITSLNLSRPSSVSEDEKIMSKEYNDDVKKQLFGNDIVLTKIFSHFDAQEDNKILLNNFIFLNKHISKIITRIIYKKCYIESTYMLALFLSTIRNDMKKKNNSKGLCDMVEVVDLSEIKSGSELFKIHCAKLNIPLKEPLDEMSLATWRDWRMKDSTIYGRNLLEMQHQMRKRTISTTSMATLNIDRPINPKKKIKLEEQITNSIERIIDRLLIRKRKRINKTSGSLEEMKRIIKPNNQLNKVKHPLVNVHLNKYKDNRDVPIGYVIHILKYFKNLKILNLDHLSISEDFIFLQDMPSYDKPDLKFVKEYFLTRQDEFKFLSDTGINRFNLRMENNIFGLTFSNFFEIFTHLVVDTNIKSLSLKSCYFVKKAHIEELLLKQYTKNNFMDLELYKSTMNNSYLWCNTPILEGRHFFVFFFMSNLVEYIRSHTNQKILFLRKRLVSFDEFIFKSQYFSLNGVPCNESDNFLKFQVCYGLNEPDSGVSFEIEDKLNDTIRVKFHFGWKTYMETNNVFLKENDFFNFHNNMSLLRLADSLRNENIDPKYYTLEILAEYLLLRMKLEYIMLKHGSIGYNTI